MVKTDSTKYTAPRAVRLSDAQTGTFACTNGRDGNADLCQSGFAVQQINVCNDGAFVQN
ncbi:MAG: hypothetical protein R6X13_02095 [bacterium]